LPPKPQRAALSRAGISIAHSRKANSRRLAKIPSRSNMA
jgi:hypothetical protein